MSSETNGNRLRGLVVTGTDTEVGKTWVTAAIVRELRIQGVQIAAAKPVCSGSVTDSKTKTVPHWEDVDALVDACGGRFSADEICPQRFHAPRAPSVAAALEGRRVDYLQMLELPDRWQGKTDLLAIEGVGGLMCPVTEAHTFADLAVDWGFPLIIVAANRLGTINHTLLTIAAARSRGLRAVAVVLNHPWTERHFASGNGDTDEDEEFLQSNIEQISRFSRIPIIGICHHAADSIELVDMARNRPISIRALFDIPVRTPSRQDDS